MKFQSFIDNREESAKQARATIETVCNSFENRKAGSEQEALASAYLQSQLQDVCEVKEEKFDVYPEAYSGVFYVVPTIAILAYIAYFFTAMVSALLALVGIVVFVLQFLTNSHALDLLYKKKESRNLTAVLPPSGEVKKRVYFVANVDATREWLLKYRLGGTLFIATLFSLFFGLLYVFFADIARWAIIGGLGSQIASGSMLIVGIVGVAFLPSYIATYFAIAKKRVVTGANENMSGCAVAIEVLKALKASQTPLEHTELGVILTGSGAVGAVGARAWCESNKQAGDAKTVFVCLNTLKEVDSLGVNTREGNGLVKNDTALADFVKNCADKAAVPFKKRALPFGHTDSAEFSRHGYSSVSVTGYNPHAPEYLHTRYDTLDNVSESCLGNAFAVCLSVVAQLDETSAND